MEREALKLALDGITKVPTLTHGLLVKLADIEAVIDKTLAQPAQEPEREALKLALKSLEEIAENATTAYCDDWCGAEAEQALTAIKAALAQPAQEPVAFNEFLESEDFYNLMQTYRHFQTDAVKPFEAVKDALRAAYNIGAQFVICPQPQCKAWTRVLETRHKYDNETYRRYECANGHRFSTMEKVKVERATNPTKAD